MAWSILAASAVLSASTAPAAPVVCTGAASLGTFELLVRPFSPGAPLPLKSVAEIGGGARLIWNPEHLVTPSARRAEVTAVLVPSADGDLILTLEPRPADARAEWQLPERPQVIALIYGPNGLSEGKIKSLVTHNRELIRQLAAYAEQSSQVESLVQELATEEASGASTDSVMQGISSKYGVSTQKLNSAGSSNDQAALLLKAVLPTSSAYDPLSAESAQAVQTGGLAASVAGLFFGNPVALAAGGAALFQNLKMVLFPNTEFRSAFTEAAPKDGLMLCTKNQAPKAKTRIAYLWAYKAPEVHKPAVTFIGTPHLPLGAKSSVPVKLGGGSAAKDLALARDWKLAPAAGGAALPVTVEPAASGALEIDLSKSKAPAGEYHLQAAWDWDTLAVSGALHLHPFGDFAHAAIAPAERDKLVEGAGDGEVAVTVSGTDFEFLEKAQMQSTARNAKPADVDFTLHAGKRGGPQNTVAIDVPTTRPGDYRLLLAQSDGVVHPIPVTVLPPNPKITNLPIRLNVKEAHEPIHLEGTGLDRVQSISSEAGTIAGAADAHGWSGEIAIQPGLARGRRFALSLKVQGLADPLAVPDAIVMVGPRPAISAAQKSQAAALGVDLADDELPAGTEAGLVLTISHLDNGARPRLELACKDGDTRQPLTLSPSEPSHGATLTFAGPDALYLSFDPGVVGYAGCQLQAAILLPAEGRSDPFSLGKVIRIPRLDQFSLTAEKVGDSSYAGILEGRDLDVIDKVGWDSQNGTPVTAIPAPEPGPTPRQKLRVVLPWPAPAPHAPLYIWLRGEQTGRKTSVAF